MWQANHLAILTTSVEHAAHSFALSSIPIFSWGSCLNRQRRAWEEAQLRSESIFLPSNTDRHVLRQEGGALIGRLLVCHSMKMTLTLLRDSCIMLCRIKWQTHVLTFGRSTLDSSFLLLFLLPQHLPAYAKESAYLVLSGPPPRIAAVVKAHHWRCAKCHCSYSSFRLLHFILWISRTFSRVKVVDFGLFANAVLSRISVTLVRATLATVYHHNVQKTNIVVVLPRTEFASGFRIEGKTMAGMQKTGE